MGVTFRVGLDCSFFQRDQFVTMWQQKAYIVVRFYWYEQQTLSSIIFILYFLTWSNFHERLFHPVLATLPSLPHSQRAAMDSVRSLATSTKSIHFAQSTSCYVCLKQRPLYEGWQIVVSAFHLFIWRRSVPSTELTHFFLGYSCFK